MDNNKFTPYEIIPVVMACDPCPNLSLDELPALIGKTETEKELAALYADVSNKAWWVADDIYDYEAGSEGYQKALDITERWFGFEDTLRERIFDILREEKVSIDGYGYDFVLIPFMKRNGFTYGAGWWIEEV